MLKAALLDLDGTLIHGDTAVAVGEIVGKQDAVHQNNLDFHNGVTKGLTGLIRSINLFRGITLDQIETKLGERDYLMPGAQELINFFRDNGVITIVASGSMLPVVEHFQRLLGIDYAIGSPVRIRDGAIQGISEEDYPDPDYKLFETKKILEALNIQPPETIAIGDSPGDKSRFIFAGSSIAIDPKGGIEAYASHVITGDLTRAIPIIKSLLK